MQKVCRPEDNADHVDTLTSMAGLGDALWNDGQYVQALPVYEEAFKLRKAKLGPDHPDTLDSMASLANGYSGVFDYARALETTESFFWTF